MKKLIYILLIICAIPFSNLFAQGYNTALGVRLGNGDDYRSGGITLQQRIFNKFTIEGIAQTDFTHNHTFHAMIQMHQNIITRNLNFYFGAGIMGGVEENNIVSTLNGNKITTTIYDNKTFGADLIAGLELTISRFNISIDYKPNFNFTGRDNWYQGQIGLSVRAIVFKAPLIDKPKKKKTESIFSKEPSKKKETKSENPTFKEFFDDLFKTPEKK